MNNIINFFTNNGRGGGGSPSFCSPFWKHYVPVRIKNLSSVFDQPFLYFDPLTLVCTTVFKDFYLSNKGSNDDVLGVDSLVGGSSILTFFLGHFATTVPLGGSKIVKTAENNKKITAPKRGDLRWRFFPHFEAPRPDQLSRFFQNFPTTHFRVKNISPDVINGLDKTSGVFNSPVAQFPINYPPPPSKTII